MPQLYYFQKDGRCDFVKRTLKNDIPRYVEKDSPTPEGDVPYYINLEWNAHGTGGVPPQWLEENKLRYIRNVRELPEGAGVFVTAYDGNQEELAELKARGVPVVERPCPWMVVLKREFQRVAPTHRCVILLDQTMLYNNYKSIFPPGALIVSLDNYRERLEQLEPGRPVHFTAYATFRRKDADEVVEYVKRHFPHPEHVFHFQGICGWVSRQGLFEEIGQAVKQHALEQVWVVASSVENRSVKSILQEIADQGARPVVLHAPEDVPQVDESVRVGIIRAPIPYHREEEVLTTIRERYGAPAGEGPRSTATA
jgi:4-hydroxy-3-methylbut-2-enyl diphosphate reductase IspH